MKGTNFGVIGQDCKYVKLCQGVVVQLFSFLSGQNAGGIWHLWKLKSIDALP
jgi:hypothetical protein